MKKILLIISIIFYLSSCGFQNNNDLTKAKNELLSQKNTNTSILNKDENIDKNMDKSEDKDLFKKDTSIPELSKDKILTWTINKQEKSSTWELNKNQVSYKIEELTKKQFIKIDNLDSKLANILSGIEITWKTIWNVDKITVRFENKTSGFPIDNYTLGQFKPWDKTFIYRAKWEFKVLDYWENDYLFEAYSSWEVSKTKLIINIPNNIDNQNINETKDIKNLDNDISYQKKIIWNSWSSIYLSFPSSPVFWEPLNVWTDTITYSNIDNLTIKRDIFSSWSINCNNITDFLRQRLNTWFYWNTCRDIIKDKWISVYVLKFDNDTYTYEKKYIDFNHWLVWDYILKTWIKADKENIKTDISKVNSELKQTNKDETISYQNYPKLKIVDKLFKDIVR